MGNLTKANVIEGISSDCDKEAIRMIESAKPWTPGYKDGKPVKVIMSVAVPFSLDKN